jgi:SAM-dependent methyltransferase
MESLYYYRDLPKALKEIHRVMKTGGLFCAVVDMYWESPATHQWVESLKVPVQLLRVEQYRSLFQNAGFTNVRDQRVIDPRPVPDDYTSGSFNSRADFVAYREAGSLMITGEAAK